MAKRIIQKQEIPKGKIMIYKEKSGAMRLKVKIEQETVLLTQKQMAELFKKDVRTISDHINNIFKEKELSRNSTIRKFRIVQFEGGRKVMREVDFYNLDVIISVGYRVKSKQGTQFRIWATGVLRDYIIKGYILNQRRLKQQRLTRLDGLQKTIALLREVIQKRTLESDETAGLLRVITDYANSWALLEKYDKGSLNVPKGVKCKVDIFNYEQAKELIIELKKNLIKKKQASQFFGVERDEGLASILLNLNQFVAGERAYGTLAEKAAHLLYFVVKDHVFIDGNKRIASLLFILFLSRNNYLFNKKGEKKINDNALVALALLVAESRSQEKNVMIALIVNLLID